MFFVSSGPTPNYLKRMIFVDGTNFLVELFKEIEIVPNSEKLAENPPLSSYGLAKELINNVKAYDQIYSSQLITIRSFWFSSYVGNDEIKEKLRNALRENGFEPKLFKKGKGKSEKGVDIALTKEMLVNAFNQNFDVALLVAGDGDYVELVNEVKRYGSIINGAFLNRGLSDNLRYALDFFKAITLDRTQQSIEKLITKIAEEIRIR